jgi:hypothetical protein
MTIKPKSKSETGHAVNSFNFEQLTLFCEKLGLKFNPPAGSGIELPKLQNKTIAIKGVNTTYHQKTPPWMLVVNRRSDLMDPVDKLFTKVKNVVDVCDVPQSYKDDVGHYVREIHGQRAKPKIQTMPGNPAEPTDETVIQISASQQGFDNKLQNVEKCFQLLKAEPKYLPNEPELSIAELDALVVALHEANTAVAEMTPDVNLARLARNKELYAASDGANLLASKVRKYIKAVFGGNSSVYHEVCKFKFTKLAKFVEN